MTEPNHSNDSQENPPPGGSGDAVDEFAGLEPAPPARSPVMPLVIVGLCLFTTFHLRHDLRYALSARSPVRLAELRGAGQSAEAVSGGGRYVTVEGIPDRRNALYVETRGEKTRETFFRLHDGGEGAGAPAVFVRARDTVSRPEVGARWTGRLRRFSDVSFASSLRDYYARGVKQSRGIELASFRTALLGPVERRLEVRDRSGRALRIASADALVEIQSKPQSYLLEVPRDKFPTRADAQHELERLLAPFGVAISSQTGAIEGVGDRSEDPDVFQFWIPLLENDLPKRNQLFAALESAGVEFSFAHPRTRLRLGDIRLDEAKNELGASGAMSIPFAEIVAVTVEEPLRITDETLVLTEGEEPGSFVWAPLVAALLLALAAWNVWYLLRPRRAR